ncbi:MAG: hypothetical protein LLG40_11270 [Deltaproteobacteria bacterium]|nr:hypothetical protein [Deltaproteobacteria bacterium]
MFQALFIIFLIVVIAASALLLALIYKPAIIPEALRRVIFDALARIRF